MIKIENLNKSIDQNLILKDACMNIPKGAVYGLVGPNGAGKSTIIRCIVGAYRIDSGSIKIDGCDVYEKPEVKSKIAYIPDDIFFRMTDTVNSLKSFYKGLYPGFDEELFAKIRELFPMLSDNKKMIRSFSKGMQRQVAFLLSLCIHPDVMVLDEPLDGLDPVMRRQILGLVVKAVSEHETTVLISSHNLRELEDICDHVGIMEGGRVLIERSLSDLQASVSKVQIAFETDKFPELPPNIEVMHKISAGRVHTLIIKGEPNVAKESLKALNPLLMDVLPLSLEEIFIYEMGGANYGTKDIKNLAL